MSPSKRGQTTVRNNQTPTHPTGAREPDLKGYAAKLRDIGNYLTTAVPSDIEPQYFIDTEALLNRIYIAAVNGKADEDILRNLISVLGFFSESSDKAKKNTYRVRSKTVQIIKEFGRALIQLATLLENQR